MNASADHLVITGHAPCHGHPPLVCLSRVSAYRMSDPDSPRDLGGIDQMIFIRPPARKTSIMQHLLNESADRQCDAQAMDEEPGCESPAANGFAMTGLFGIIPDADAPPIRLPANNRLDTALD